MKMMLLMCCLLRYDTHSSHSLCWCVVYWADYYREPIGRFHHEVYRGISTMAMISQLARSESVLGVGGWQGRSVPSPLSEMGDDGVFARLSEPAHGAERAES